MTIRGVVVDTGAWLGAIHRRDQYHSRSAAFLRELRTRRAPLVVTDLIIAELHAHLLRGLGPERARAQIEAIVTDPLVHQVFTDRELQTSALSEWIAQYGDQPFTLTDAVSFAVMHKHRIEAAFTFDHHFRVAGFEVVP